MELQLSEPPVATSSASRVLSVDVLRGLVMFTMVFVNDAYGAQGSPWWLKHWSDLGKSAGPSGMTFVDCVFPAFLFIVGMSIPIAIEGRRGKGDSWLRIIGHMLLRTISLLFLGILMVNGERGAVPVGWMGQHKGLWESLLFAGAIIAFHSLPLKNQKAKYVSGGFRALGIGFLIYLACIFRTKHGGYLTPSWWGILGLIGWAYFGCSVLYLILRQERIGALVAGVALCLCVYAADFAGTFHAFSHFKITLAGTEYPIGSWFAIEDAFGSQAAITMAGVVVGSLLLARSEMDSPREKMRFAAVFAALLALGGLLLTKYGISKNEATPTWCLYCAAITTLIWIGLYWVIDVAGWRAWSIPLAWAGASALMIYILSEGIDGWRHQLGHFASWNWYDSLEDAYPRSVLHKFITAAGISLIGGVLGRVGVRLKL